MSLTILGGRGFVGKHYVDQYYHHAIADIHSINSRNDYSINSADVLYLISTVTNYNVFEDVHIDIDTNLTVLMTVLENWKKHQDRTREKGVFNFISSWSVYGNQASLPVPETAVCDPKGFYIITKRCAEQLLMSYCETFDLKYRIIRLSNVAGPGDKCSIKKNALQHAINQLKAGEDVVLFGDGKFYRDFIHVKDCARAIETIMCLGDVNAVYNVGNGKTWDYGTILNFVKEETKAVGTVKYVEPNAFQRTVPVASFYMDVSKLKALGFVPEYTEEKLFRALSVL